MICLYKAEVQWLQGRITEDISKIQYDTNTLAIVFFMCVICADQLVVSNE